MIACVIATTARRSHGRSRRDHHNQIRDRDNVVAIVRTAARSPRSHALITTGIAAITSAIKTRSHRDRDKAAVILRAIAAITAIALTATGTRSRRPRACRETGGGGGGAGTARASEGGRRPTAPRRAWRRSWGRGPASGGSPSAPRRATSSGPSSRSPSRCRWREAAAPRRLAPRSQRSSARGPAPTHTHTHRCNVSPPGWALRVLENATFAPRIIVLTGCILKNYCKCKVKITVQ